MPDKTAQPVQVEFTPEFKRNIRQLAKKYRHLQADVQPVIAQLEAGQTPGTQIPRTGYTVFKVRIKNSDIQKGKRSGFRMIYSLLRRKFVASSPNMSPNNRHSGGDNPVGLVGRLGPLPAPASNQ